MQNLKELNRLERIITIQKINDLDINPIKGNFDYQHLKNIHKFIFEYVYVFKLDLIEQILDYKVHF